MSQSAIQVSTTPPLPGLTLVNQINAALNTLTTQFAGSDDPAQYAQAYSLWADTANNLLKRRNAANTDWVIVADLLSKAASLDGVDTAPEGDSSRLIANTEFVQNAVSAINDEISDVSFVANNAAADLLKVFALNQDYVNVSGSRVLGTTYTNTTSRPILVYASIIVNSLVLYNVSINGVVVISNQISGATALRLCVPFIVFPGDTYSVSGTSIASWWELR